MTSRVGFLIARFIVVFLSFASACSGADISERTAPTHYAGQVLDFDSGVPISGVVVTVIWYGETASVAGQAPRDEFHAAFEMRTDVDGSYKVPARPTRQLPHHDILQKPAALFFLAGFIDWHHRFEPDPGSPYPRMIVQLKKVQDPVEALKDVSIPRFVPYAEIPLLVGALNRERARLGLPALAPSE